MSKEKKKPYSDRRWNDPPAFEVIGSARSTEEERKRIDAQVEAFCKKNGILKEDEHIEDFRVD